MKRGIRVKVLYYVTGISPTIGGIEKFILNYYERKDKGIEIDILTRYCDKSTLMYRMFEEKGINIISLDIHHLGVRTISAFYHRLKIFFETNKGKYDVLHTHCIIDPFLVTLAKRNGIDRVFTHVHSYNNSRTLISSVVKNLASYRNSIQADICLACSRDVGVATYPKKCLKKLIEMVNGIDSTNFEFNQEIRDEYRKDLNIEHNYVICNVARMEPIKNHHFLVDIFKFVLEKKENAVLLLVGDGVLKTDIEEYSFSIGVNDKVLFLGEQENVSALLQASDVFVMPSKSEGLGIAAIEAQASGLMTFVSKDVVPNRVDCTGLVSYISLEKSAEEWAQYILEKTEGACRDSQCEKIGKSEFDISYMAKKLNDLYVGGNR